LSGRTSRILVATSPAIQLGDHVRGDVASAAHLGSAVPDIRRQRTLSLLIGEMQLDGSAETPTPQTENHPGCEQQAHEEMDSANDVQRGPLATICDQQALARAFGASSGYPANRLSKLPGGAARPPGSLRSRFRLCGKLGTLPHHLEIVARTSPPASVHKARQVDCAIVAAKQSEPNRPSTAHSRRWNESLRAVTAAKVRWQTTAAFSELEMKSTS